MAHMMCIENRKPPASFYRNPKKLLKPCVSRAVSCINRSHLWQLVYFFGIKQMAVEHLSLMISAPLPSGKLLQNYRKSPVLMGKSTISMAIFNSKL